jgi:undecaprenyl-diphosphatase
VNFWPKRWFKVFAWSAAALGAALCVLIPLQAMFKVIDTSILLPKEEAARIEDGVTRAEKIDLTNELYGWKEAGEQIKKEVSRKDLAAPFIFTHRHYIASQLSFYIPGRPRVYTLSDRVDAYDFWQRDLSALEGKDGVFVTNDYFYVDPSTVYPFKKWEKPVEVDIFRKGRKVRAFWITVGRNFDLKALPPEYGPACLDPKQTLMQCVRKADYRVFWFFNKRVDFKLVDYLMWKFTRFDTDYGLNSGLVILIVAVACILWFFRREKFLPEFILFLGIMGVGGILVHILKDIFDRMRPLAVFGPQVRVFHELWERGSFPSGHSQIAFSVATYLSSRFKKFWWLFYAGAAAMGLSRVYIGVHFPVDVLAGALVGTGVALIMIKLVKIE